MHNKLVIFNLLIFIIVVNCDNSKKSQTADQFARAYFKFIKNVDINGALQYRFKAEDEALYRQYTNLPVEYTDEERFRGDFNDEVQELFIKLATRKEKIELDSLESRYQRKLYQFHRQFEESPSMSEKQKESLHLKIQNVDKEEQEKINKFIKNIFRRLTYAGFKTGTNRPIGQFIAFLRNNYIVVNVTPTETHEIEVEKILNLNGIWRIIEHN